MTTRKHEIEESMRDDTHACPFCMENEADSICDNCSGILCVECTTTVKSKGVLCPTCNRNDLKRERQYQLRKARNRS